MQEKITGLEASVEEKEAEVTRLKEVEQQSLDVGSFRALCHVSIDFSRLLMTKGVNGRICD